MRGSIVKRGSKYSIVIYLGRDQNGKKKQKWYSGYTRKKDAEKDLNRILGEIEEGSFVIPSRMLLSDYLSKWLDDYGLANLKPKTIDGYRSYIDNHVSKSIGHMPLEDLKPYQIQEFYDALFRNGRVDGKGGLSAKSILQVHRILSKALKRAQKLQLIKQNPCDYVELPKVKRFKPNVYNEKQLMRLIECSKDEEIYIPVVLASTLGLRRGEALGLTWDSIDFENKVITINKSLIYIAKTKSVEFSSTKTESGNRRILISDHLVSILREHKESQDRFRVDLESAYHDWNLVCCYVNGRYFHPSRFSHKFRVLLNKHGLEHIRFHDLRHTNATLMLEGNIPAKIASQRLGHSSIQVTLDIYSHVRDEAQKDTVDLMDKLIK